MKRKRVAAVVSHPIQYQAPLFRYLSRCPEIDLFVYFDNDHGIRPSMDPGFGKSICFDIPLTEGYNHAFLTFGRGFNRTNVMLIRGLAHLVDELKRQSFDWVWIHGYARGHALAALAAAGVLGIPVLLRGESTLLDPKPKLRDWAKRCIMRMILTQCSAYAFIGDKNREFYLRYGADPRKMFFAPYSVDNETIAAGASRAIASGKAAQVRQSLGIGPDQKLCLFVGKLIERKRPMDLIRALHRLPSDVGAILLGDGSSRAEIEREIIALGVRARVEGFVNQSELGAYYAAADMLVLPSAQETWGLVANEAMACGKPVVVSDKVGAGHDLVATSPEGVGTATGTIYPCGDIDALAAAISTIARAIDSDPTGVRNAVIRRIEKYGIAATADGLLAAFMSNVDASSGRFRSSQNDPHYQSRSGGV